MVLSKHLELIKNNFNQTDLVNHLIKKGIIKNDDIHGYYPDENGCYPEVFEWLVFPGFDEWEYRQIDEAGLPSIEFDYGIWVGITNFENPHKFSAYRSLVDVIFGEKTLSKDMRNSPEKGHFPYKGHSSYRDYLLPERLVEQFLLTRPIDEDPDKDPIVLAKYTLRNTDPDPKSEDLIFYATHYDPMTECFKGFERITGEAEWECRTLDDFLNSNTGNFDGEKLERDLKFKPDRISKVDGYGFQIVSDLR